MTDLTHHTPLKTNYEPTTDYKPYQEALWQPNPKPSDGLWREPSNGYGSIPEPLYRLRVSVLRNGQGRDDCLPAMFVFPTLDSLHSATQAINTRFGGAFSTCHIQQSAINGDQKKENTTDEDVISKVEDGRTVDMVLGFEEDKADESWKEFCGRLKELQGGWKRDEAQ